MDGSISHYRIIEILGSGGMGEVYKAQDLNLNRIVALKILSPELMADQQAQHRLVEEAQHAAVLNHSHIATIYELGQDGDSHFIAMEYVEGETLAQRTLRGPLEIGEALEIAIQAAEALDAAHARGLVHCDIKSSNIMLARDGLVKVLDFGLARATPGRDGAATAESLPSADAPMVTGTASYMSPEQARGEAVDERSDIFSLGVVLYEMAAGRRPFEGESNRDAIDKILSVEPPPLGAFHNDAPLELESIIRKALEKNRHERYQTISDMLSDLLDLKNHLDAETSRLVEDDSQTHAVIKASRDKEPSSNRLLLGLIRHRKWLLALSLLALALAILDTAFLQPQGGGRLRAPVLITVAILGLIGYAALRAQPRSLRPAFALPRGAAFRGLLPFQEADRDRFYGREIETEAMSDLIAHDEFRFGVLYGDSGCGKTSLVRAGLMPRLKEKGYLPVYCRSYKDPLAEILEECRKLGIGEPFDVESAIDFLRRAAEQSGLVFVCDQFEEFFVNFRTRKKREPFISFVVACNQSIDLPVKFLFSLRSDFLYLISAEFDGRIPEPLMMAKRYHLRNFDEELAANIIEKSAKRANLPFEEEMSQQVASDLADNDMVLPSELQIVGEQLQNKRLFTLEEYRRAGGKEQLVHSYLEDVIQASADRDAACLLLRSLVSDENTRLTLTLEEISRRTQRPRQTIERILKLFAQARLIREIQDHEPWRYELMHEYLIEKINRITGRVMDATQRANRLFRQCLSNYVVDKRSRIPVSELWFIRRYSDIERGSRERELLKKSLRWGAVKLIAFALLLAAGTTMVAAALSVSEEWDMLRLSDGHTAAARQAVFSPDGKLLVSVGEDAKVIVWDFEKRERLATLTDHTDWVNGVAFSPDGKWFATASADHTVIVWDAARFDKLAELREHKSPVFAVAFSPDGKVLATSSGTAEYRRTILWETGAWKILQETPLGTSYGPLIFSSDSRYLIIQRAYRWDTSTGQLDDPDKIWAGNWIAVSQNGRYIVSVDGEGEVRFSDLKERKLLSSHRVHRDHGRAAAFSPDGRYAATGAEDVILWDAATQTKLVRFEHTAIVWSVAFSPDGRRLISTHGDGSILLWDVDERERAANFNGHSASVRAVAFSPDGKRIASASEDRSIIVWDAVRRQKEAVLIGHGTRVTSVAFTADGEGIFSSDQGGNFFYWDMDRRKPRWALPKQPPHNVAIYCIAVSPDSRLVANTNGVYDIASARNIKELLTPTVDQGKGAIYGADFSSDGQRLACATPEGYLFVFDTRTWKVSDSVFLSGFDFITVSYSPDGKWLVTGEDEGLVRLWNASPLRQIAVIGNHDARIKSVSFSPDGRQIVSASDDKSICLWDVNSRSLITRIGTHSAPVLSAAFSPDGRQIVSGEHDYSVRIYTRHRSLWGYRLD